MSARARLRGVMVERVPELDNEDAGTQAWRLVDPCGEDCIDPMHTFGSRRPRKHVEWLVPGDERLEVVESARKDPRRQWSERASHVFDGVHLPPQRGAA